MPAIPSVVRRSCRDCTGSSGRAQQNAGANGLRLLPCHNATSSKGPNLRAVPRGEGFPGRAAVMPATGVFAMPGYRIQAPDSHRDSHFFSFSGVLRLATIFSKTGNTSSN
jgi:hypothetical protein